MIVRPNKTVEQNSLFPNVNWYENEPENYVVDETTEEGKALAAKILECAPYMELVVEDGKLVDVIPLPKPDPPPPPPNPMDVLGQQLVEKELQIFDLQQQNNILGSTLVSLELRLLALEGSASA